MEQSAALGLGLLSTVIVTIIYMLVFPDFFFSRTAAGLKNKNKNPSQRSKYQHLFCRFFFSHTQTFRDRKMHLPVPQDIH